MKRRKVSRFVVGLLLERLKSVEDRVKEEKRMVSAGNMSLIETDISNVFLFFKKDGTSFENEDLTKMQQLSVGFLMKFMEYYEHKSIENQFLEVAISQDYEIIKLTLYDKSSFEIRELH